MVQNIRGIHKIGLHCSVDSMWVVSTAVLGVNLGNFAPPSPTLGHPPEAPGLGHGSFPSHCSTLASSCPLARPHWSFHLTLSLDDAGVKRVLYIRASIQA
jgi:hypothetical protein